MGNVTFCDPVNPPGTVKDEQVCEFCLVQLTDENRAASSKDPDYIAACLYQFCEKCRRSKLGRVPDSDYLAPEKKWRRITYQMFWNSRNAAGFWEFVKALRPFGDQEFDPLKEG